MKSVGKSIPRKDGFEKVTGRAKYLDDLDIPNCWYAHVVRSTIPYGKIKKIEYNSKFDWKKVTVVDYKDIPGKNKTLFITEDQLILAEDVVHHVGEAIVLIAAPTKELAIEAGRNVKITYEELTPVLSIDESKKKKNVIWGDDNILSKYHIKRGDVKKGFADADFIIEDTYQTPAQEHTYIEPQAIAAVPRNDGGLTIMGSMQCPYYVLKTLKSVFNMGPDKMNVVQTVTGGAFGGKEDYPSVTGSYVGLLALKAKRSVKLVYTRDEDMSFTPKRHPSLNTIKIGVKKDGTIAAMDIDFALDGGAYVTLSNVVLSRGIIHACGVYKCDNISAKAHAYATNNVPYGAFRGFGAPQSFFGLERHIDKVAETIGMNPYEFRKLNCVRVGDKISTGQVMKESVAGIEALEAATKASDFVRKWKEYNKQWINKGGVILSASEGSSERLGILHSVQDDNNIQTGKSVTRSTAKQQRGIGIVLFMHGGAFTGSGEAIMKTEAGLRLDRGGKVSVLSGCTDMGQGACTVLPQIAADSLNLPVELVDYAQPDTDQVPDSGPTVASRTTMIIGATLEKAAQKFKDKFLKFISDEINAPLENLYIKDGFVFNKEDNLGEFVTFSDKYLEKVGELKEIARYSLPPGINWDPEKHLGDAYPAYSWACFIAEVKVDPKTFVVEVEKMTMAVDVGKAVNPVLLEGQIEGGTLQALGYGLMEDGIYKDGKVMNNRFQTYIIPTIKDTPDWNTLILEYPVSHGPQGAKGVGELPMDGGAPAILNAIYNATGLWVTELPASPERLYQLSCHPER
ncbi:xanthine dehydrogenase family protein molybdopterin-binding subunit [bacterium]|nr:xanthine dehydrogenase family protein molybdopterin-binding subunit [bacterium]